MTSHFSLASLHARFICLFGLSYSSIIFIFIHLFIFIYHVTDAEVRRLLLSAPCKSSDLDPLPTGLVKDCIDILVTPIVSIVNLSLSEGCFPIHFKSALVSPLLKNPHSIGMTRRSTGLCLISVSFPKFLRRLWQAV